MITLTAIAGLIPQGNDASFYIRRFSQPVAEVLLAFGFHRFFSSPLFLVPSFLLLLNLILCSIRRFVKKKKAYSSLSAYGPDIIHLGIVICIAGCFLSLFLMNLISSSLPFFC
jgi:cytochrome c biogenesis protein ResB